MRGIRREACVIERFKLLEAAAVNSLQNGAPLPVVMRAGGWRKLEIVNRYTQFTDAIQW